MIDSSGRKGLRANGTVFDLLPIGQVIGISGGLLVVLFTLIEPEASNGLGATARLLFWGFHVFLGLGALWIAGRWLASGEWLPSGTLLCVLITGCAGILIATPGYLLLDAVFSPYIVDNDPEPPVDGIFLKMALEALQLAPWFLVTWVIINLPVLLPADPSATLLNNGADHPLEQDTATHNLQSNAREVSPGFKQPSDQLNPEPLSTARPQDGLKLQPFLSSLPGIIGTDVIAVASDLHYLNVWTVAGRTTVLGNLRDVASELGDAGMQVHRSHWVAHKHVRRIIGNAGSTACILSNELRVPISRRRWKTVREQYGRSTVNADTRVTSSRLNSPD